MTQLFKKLNFKGQKEIFVINSPTEFTHELETMMKITSVKTDLKDCKELEFILAFVKTKPEVDKMALIIEQKLKGDGLVWFAYPKGTSKKYKAEINRDNGWESIANIGLETVRAVAIDEDWSALRFRRVEFVKPMNRNEKIAITEEGKLRTKKNSGK
ncbi:MAG: hypothetical protein WBP45_01570 [Daejeonella sp.]